MPGKLVYIAMSKRLGNGVRYPVFPGPNYGNKALTGHMAPPQARTKHNNFDCGQASEGSNPGRVKRGPGFRQKIPLLASRIRL